MRDTKQSAYDAETLRLQREESDRLAKAAQFAAIASGTTPAIDEDEKRLVGVLLADDAVIVLDDIKRPLKCDDLDNVVSALFPEAFGRAAGKLCRRMKDLLTKENSSSQETEGVSNANR